MGLLGVMGDGKRREEGELFWNFCGVPFLCIFPCDARVYIAMGWGVLEGNGSWNKRKS